MRMLCSEHRPSSRMRIRLLVERAQHCDRCGQESGESEIVNVHGGHLLTSMVVTVFGDDVSTPFAGTVLILLAYCYLSISIVTWPISFQMRSSLLAPLQYISRMLLYRL